MYLALLLPLAHLQPQRTRLPSPVRRGFSWPTPVGRDFSRALRSKRCPVIFRIACALPVCLLASTAHVLAGDVVDLAASLIGRPYVWGAEGPRSFDCSGLTQYVFQEFGIDLPRRAVDQSKTGDSARRLQRGDLLFFSTDADQSLVTHVGIYEGADVMIDASKRHGRVRRDNLREDFWVDRFLFARRISAMAGDDEPRETRDNRTDDPPGRSSDRRRAAVGIIERIAGELFKRPTGTRRLR